MKVVVTGSRTWLSWDYIVRTLIGLQGHKEARDITIIHGDAPGADYIASRTAHRLGYEVDRVPADWDFYGTQAGFVRNCQMLNRKPDRVLAFWNGRSHGTRQMIQQSLDRMARRESTLRRVEIHLSA